MTKIIDGKKISQEILLKLKDEVENLKKDGITITLAVIVVGDNPASLVYVNNKKKACKEVGINSLEYALPEDVDQTALLKLISKLNDDINVNGILVQLPLPKHIDEKNIIEAIDPKKDVDGFCEVNVGKITLGNYKFAPCTPAGIMELLKHENIEVEGKHCVVVGRSNIVGKPMALLLLNNNATVTVCHVKTNNLSHFTKQADVIVCAAGKRLLIKEDMVKENAVVIDVGINRDENNKICGDVDFENVSKKTSYITPVPGGVGPMTIAMLIKNTVASAKNNL